MKYLLAITIFFLFSRCTNNDSYIKENNKIPEKIKDEVRPITERIYGSFLERNDSILVKMAAKDEASNIYIYDTIFKYCSFIKMKSPDFDFLVKNSNVSVINKISLSNFEYDIDLFDGYSYVSIKPIMSTDKRSVFFVISVLSKSALNEDSPWELRGLGLGVYRHDGKTAIEYYNDAKELYKKDKVLESYYDMRLVSNLLSAGGPRFHYKEEKEIKDFAEQIKDVVREKKLLPFTISEISTRPNILNIGTALPHGRIISSISYYTTLTISDTSNLRKECFAVNSSLSGRIPELSVTTDSTLYYVKNINERNGLFVFAVSNK